ncbi:MAG TPA: nuclear transport factor 2 family protein [Mycobacterium sp.]|nr:nuclear transport factor 2 family protein [Mycobacterium sp.]
MPTPTAVAQRLYDAMAHADGAALFGLLTEDFVGTVSTGMPHGVGGEHHGAADMITGVWARIASIYDMHVDPLDYLQVDDDRVVVLGRYWGAARDGGPAVDAAFAHVITTRGDMIAALRQITDTARWGIEPTP